MSAFWWYDGAAAAQLLLTVAANPQFRVMGFIG
jgi:hypothetical protein